MSQIDRYEIIEEFARGKFVTRYKARDRQLNRLVDQIEADPQTKKQRMPAYLQLSGGIVGMIIIAVVFLTSCSNNIEPDFATQEVAIVATTNTDAIPTAAEDAGAIDEGEDEAEPLSPDQLKDVPREDTLIMGWDMRSTSGVTNPWTTDYDHADANAMMWEGLAYYRIFADESQPWLAENMEYTKADFTELTIRLRPEAKWSDGTPVTSKDVVYTFEGHLNNDLLPYHAAFDQFVASIAQK
jgi:ABC-type transport system substrate-binding protein